MRPAPRLFERLPAQYFTGILAAAAAARAQDRPGVRRFIDLGRGNPDLPPPPHAIEAVRAAGASAAALPLDAGSGWQPDFGAAGHQRPAAVLLNYPSNPCAACEHDGTFERAVEWCAERDAWLVHDLAYGFLAFDGRRARSVL